MNENLEILLRVRFSKSQYDYLKTVAHEYEASISKTIRELCLQSKITITSVCDKDLLVETRSIGVNLNQAVKRLHTYKGILAVEQDIDELHDIIIKLKELIQKLQN